MVAKGEMVGSRGSGPGELLSQPEVPRASDLCSTLNEIVFPTRGVIQKNGPGPRGGNLNTVIRRIKRQRQAARCCEESTLDFRGFDSITEAVRSKGPAQGSLQSLQGSNEESYTLEIKERTVVRRVQLTPSLPRASVPPTDLKVITSKGREGRYHLVWGTRCPPEAES